MTRITGALREDVSTFIIVHRLFLRRMRKIAEEIKTRILCSITFFFLFENHAVYEIMWKNMVELDRPQMTI